ncbi:TadE/TadG family type IV pilus assembly protein [Bosea sp. (in: a-proteobacteria)]|uniref:TadE/TadG family type IV pilus assembly protein n=1 Tax=Bosea sp. (in: a-proteobacteria) TaxID=1871050 RepID=UPI00120066BC|nr:TadE/TadG family type IV pilus assembly protein [Bosea sp. (in: a-proteobacteria)]TAJ31245.1 MAG: pilus assembly protein [Bosea sp. (in: a-proteobacteria)]
MLSTRLKQHLLAFREDRKGVALVEFAVALPVMLVAYLGTVDVTQMVMASRKVTQLTSALADLTARAQIVAPADVNNIFDAAQMILAPFSSTPAKMVISNVVIDSTGTARVCWSSQRNSAALARGTTVTLPTALRVPNTSVIMARASYDYTPITGYVITGAVTLGNDPIYTRPRGAQAAGSASIEQVIRTDANPCPSFS